MKESNKTVKEISQKTVLEFRAEAIKREPTGVEMELRSDFDHNCMVLAFRNAHMGLTPSTHPYDIRSLLSNSEKIAVVGSVHHIRESCKGIAGLSSDVVSRNVHVLIYINDVWSPINQRQAFSIMMPSRSVAVGRI